MTTCSAPAKIILFGEHAVVYGRPALAVPVHGVQATVTVTASRRRGVWFQAPGIGLDAELGALPPLDPLAETLRGVLSALEMTTCPPISIRVDSTIPVASGLGSGAAVSVALIRALSTFLGQPLDDERTSSLAFEIERLHHGTPSGIDNTVIAHARPVYYVRGMPVEVLNPGAAFTLVIADTGIPAPTREAVGSVRALWQADPPRWERVFDDIAALVRQARDNLVRGEWRACGALMDANHALLVSLTVSCPALDHLVTAARAAGALGAKMSGGGRGGNMLALVEKDNAPAVAEALASAGARRTLVTQVDQITA
jgi:mevalonate kinase